ncbi:hypothetical protein SAMN04488595_101360 [Ralstonia sp. 25mfcol4.1]|nr:hypothetical protein SAMN04488595_101360 [Ralstonia sp. 25mfcol4.1]
MSGSCPRRSREHARKESEGGRIAGVADAFCYAAGWARVKGEGVGVPSSAKSLRAIRCWVGRGQMGLLLMQRYLADAGGRGRGRLSAVPSARATLPIAAGPGWPGRVKEQVIRTQQLHAIAKPTCPLAGAPLVLRVLRSGAAAGSSNYDDHRQVAAGTAGRLAGCHLPGRHRFPVRAVFSHRCGCPWLAPALNSFLPEHSVSTCRPAGCRSRLWATSCAPARRVRAADCHHLPVWRLAGYATCGRRAGLAATRSVKCEISRGYWWDYPRQLPGCPAYSVPVCRKNGRLPVGVRAKHRLHRSHIPGIWPGTAGKLY